jgi:hypothetical protein
LINCGTPSRLPQLADPQQMRRVPETHIEEIRHDLQRPIEVLIGRTQS